MAACRMPAAGEVVVEILGADGHSVGQTLRVEQVAVLVGLDVTV
jgi:hypothetical protein